MKILYHRDRSKNQIFTCFAMRLSRCPAGLGALGAGCRPCEMDFWFALQPTRCGSSGLPRKEVIQPHLPIRLPCYDFTPIADPTFGRCLLTVSLRTSGIANSHGVTGGVYKTRERIHRDILIRDY